MAYASNLRQKMATGSVVLAVRMHYYEWWSRALKPGVHFVEVSEGDDLCEDILAKVGPAPCRPLCARIVVPFTCLKMGDGHETMPSAPF